MMKLKIFATCPVFLEDLLEEEILRSGGKILKRNPGGHLFECTLKQMYHFILWSRIASRVLLYLGDFVCHSIDDVYKAAHEFSWENFMACENTISCACTVSSRTTIAPKSATLKTKDGIADYWRDKTGARPNVDRDNPDISVTMHIQDGEGTLYLDLSGEGLHKRGYRLDAGKAGLKENTAAAILYRAGWPRIAATGGGLIDPMCGSGTLLIEAAFMAAELPPNILRVGYGFFHWSGHDPDLWESTFDEAESLWEERKKNLSHLVGYDYDKDALAAALENIRRAGLEGFIHLEKKELSEFSVTDRMKKVSGLIVTNPPYGQRIGDKGALYSLYRTLGDLGRNPDLKGWHLSVISDDEGLLRSIGLKSSRKNKVMNGPIRCSLFHFDLFGKPAFSEEGREDKAHAPREIDPEKLSPEAQQFLNRVKKNIKQLRKWKKKEELSCYRLYDADLPNFNFTVDCYEDKWVHMQEYAASAGIDEKKAEQRIKLAIYILSSLLGIPESSVFTKQRRRQTGNKQCKTVQRAGERYLVNENGCRFWVNFTDYLDTGIFLDLRNVRKYLRENSKDKKVLNLFCYTATASVMAAAGAARQVTSIDTSASYLKWGQDNFLLNKIRPENHRFLKSDVPRWLGSTKEKFDLIFMDPPTFSSSKSRMDTLEIQEDHLDLIQKAMNCLNPEGTLIFSNNFKKFIMDESLAKKFKVEEVSTWTQSPDFVRKGASHRCWFISFN
ncbi:MAG: 23S rRNA (guanine(2445)-N(2))/(guanine(2069)-N(7))-methyltransferase [Spirochaetaceae bacterium 4572_59]|nr:MAG: 23S rRNA (guanine(2445)-N(2))/(guanine(2069)-N(7))-methyltransferase [Spirochaetaceae bacterium 4572_59]